MEERHRSKDTESNSQRMTHQSGIMREKQRRKRNASQMPGGVLGRKHEVIVMGEKSQRRNDRG
jgi:hypothetical protein